jgi:importin subunit alpha-6/7
LFICSFSAARSADPTAILEGVTAIRRLLSKESHPPAAQVLQSGILSRLIGLIAAAPDAKTQFEAAWAVTNIASTD